MRDVRVSKADLLMIKPAPSFCDRGVNTFWIGLLAGAMCYQGGCASASGALQVYLGVKLKARGQPHHSECPERSASSIRAP